MDIKKNQSPAGSSGRLADELTSMNFTQRENGFLHHSYEEEMLPYDYIKNGNPLGIPLLIRLFTSGKAGKLSDDPVRNYKYLFVSVATLLTRYSIDGGLEQQEAYNVSDLYIQHVDTLQSCEKILTLLERMASDFVNRINHVHDEKSFQKPIQQCFDYIFSNLHHNITLQELSDHVNLSPAYLSALFSNEVGMTLTDYIRKKKIETAKNMLLHSEYTYSEISAYLAFSSHSHFSSIFKKETGMTPREYRNRYFHTMSGIK